jgi:hypothetical protein
MTAKRRANSTVDWTGTSENRSLGLCHVMPSCSLSRKDLVQTKYSPCRLLCHTRRREREILQNRKSLNWSPGALLAPPPASRSCSRVLSAASRRALIICRGCRAPPPAASSPYGRRSPSGEGGVRGLGALWSTAHCCIMSVDTFGKHDQQLGVELMRMYCDPRRDWAWCPKWGVKSPSPAPAMQPDQRSLSSPPGWTFRRYVRQRLRAGRPHDRRSCWRSI